MNYKIYLDDVRIPPSLHWNLTRNFIEIKEKIELYGCPSHISFDHDLGEGEPSGLDIAKWLVQQDLDFMFFIPYDFTFQVHSMNPVGKKNIESYLNNYLTFRKNT